MSRRITTQVGCFSDGLPYNRKRDGSRPLIVAGIYHWVSCGDGHTAVLVDCLRRGCGSWGRRSLTARF